LHGFALEKRRAENRLNKESDKDEKYSWLKYCPTYIKQATQQVHLFELQIEKQSHITSIDNF
jgi:hypothetical protein